jgi:two-component system response regulator PilR (NtrC family)
MARVLVADDEPAIREFIQAVCEMDGHDVRTVASADDALDAYGHYMPDLLILDINMPGGGGEAVMSQLALRGRPCPTIFVTGMGGALDEREREELGAQAVLGKPFSLDSLRIAVKSALGSRS